MSKPLQQGDSSRLIETRIVGVFDDVSRSACKIVYSNDELNINTAIYTKSHLSISPLYSTPLNKNSNAIIWANSSGEINMRRSDGGVINLFDSTNPLGYSNYNGDTHNRDSKLPDVGQGSIQFKKNQYSLGASSQFQYNYSSNVLLISNIAPLTPIDSLNFQIGNTNVITLQNIDNEDCCQFKNVVIDVNKNPIKRCSYLSFEPTASNYINQRHDEIGAIYTSLGNTGSYPFEKTGNILIQPKAGCSITFPTTSLTEITNWKNTVIIKDDNVSINPSRGTKQKFIEFDASSHTRRMNIHGQDGDNGVWSLVHTSQTNLEFQYFQNGIVNDYPSQILTMKNTTTENAYSYTNKHLCELSGDDVTFNKELSGIIYIHNSSNSYYFSNDSQHYTKDYNYCIYSRNAVFNFSTDSEYNSIAFYSPNSSMLTPTISSMVWQSSYWVATSNSFSFTMNINFLDVIFDNNSEYKQQNVIHFSRQNEYTAYDNYHSGFLAGSTGNFKNTSNDNNINLVNFDDANPVVEKVSRICDNTVVGVFGRMEQSENIERPFFWGGFGTTIYGRDKPRVVITSTGFVGMWVVINDGVEITYQNGDLLTSHSCGAAIKQTTSLLSGTTNCHIIYDFTIGKIIVNSESSSYSLYQSENPGTRDIDGVTIELKGVMLLL